MTYPEIYYDYKELEAEADSNEELLEMIEESDEWEMIPGDER